MSSALRYVLIKSLAQHWSRVHVDLATDMNDRHLIASVARDRQIHLVLLIVPGPKWAARQPP